MANYATDADLEKVYPLIVDQSGVSSWADVHTEAAALIDRDLDVKWYRQEATARGDDWQGTRFDNANIATGTCTRLGVYKAIELAAGYLTNSPDDNWERIRDYYHGRYLDELDAMLSRGIDYDWDEDSSIEDTERLLRAPRTLVRG